MGFVNQLHHFYQIFAVLNPSGAERRTFIKALFSEPSDEIFVDLKKFDDDIARLSLLKDALMLTRDTSIDATKIGYCFWMARELGLLPQERSKSGLRELVSSEHAKVIGAYLQEFGGTIGYWNGVGIAATAAGFAVASAHKLSNLPTTAKSYSSDDLHSLHEALVVMMDDALGRKDMAILALGTETTHAWLNVIDQRYEVAITRDYAYFDIRSMWEFASRRSLRIRILHGLEPIFHRTTVHPSHSGGSL